MAELRTDDATLHFEVEGSGKPVTVFAHGLTNSCMELAAFTPMAPGTKVRFCFRGHGHSSTPGPGAYRYADLARDLDAIASETGASQAVGTSLGAGALARLIAGQPDRFERVVFVLPSILEGSIGISPIVERTAELLETLPREQAIEAILRESGRARTYEVNPGLRAFDLVMWQDMNPVGVARAIREAVRDVAVPDLDALGRVVAPALVIAREGDPIHPASVARRLGEVLQDVDLVVLDSESDFLASIGMLVDRVSRHLAGAV